MERQFYETQYAAFVESQNERNAKIRHTERNRSIPDLLSSRKTCPEETIYQLGTMDDHASAEDLLNIVTEFIEEFKAKFGEHVHVLDWALHLDESTPHIHERHVFDCENKYGEVAPQQEKTLEALGFELPDPDKSLSRRNNRKITFDAACRKMLFEIAKRHGLDLEEEAEYGNRKYLEKQDFILAKQKEQLAAQQSKLDELTSAGHERVCSPPFGHRAGQVSQDHAIHRYPLAGEAAEAGSSAERQRTGQGESTGLRSATAEPFADRTGAAESICTAYRREVKKSFSIIVRGDVY